jgi:hypothetical protein
MVYIKIMAISPNKKFKTPAFIEGKNNSRSNILK